MAEGKGLEPYAVSHIRAYMLLGWRTIASTPSPEIHINLLDRISQPSVDGDRVELYDMSSIQGEFGGRSELSELRFGKGKQLRQRRPDFTTAIHGELHIPHITDETRAGRVSIRAISVRHHTLNRVSYLLRGHFQM